MYLCRHSQLRMKLDCSSPGGHFLDFRKKSQISGKFPSSQENFLDFPNFPGSQEIFLDLRENFWIVVNFRDFRKVSWISGFEENLLFDGFDFFFNVFFDFADWFEQGYQNIVVPPLEEEKRRVNIFGNQFILVWTVVQIQF